MSIKCQLSLQLSKDIVHKVRTKPFGEEVTQILELAPNITEHIDLGQGRPQAFLFVLFI